MSVRVCTRLSRAGIWVIGMLALGAASATAQTVSLPAADTTLRDGAYTDTNYGGFTFVETKSDNDPSKIRRALFQFDTHTTIPAGSLIDSATLTLTVKSGSVPMRHLAVYCVPSSFDEFQATWRHRESSLLWTTPGGDVTHQHGTIAVTNVAGSKVTIDVTGIVEEAMQQSSRYTRLLLVDIDGTTTASYMAYYSNDDLNPAMRPTLVVNYSPAPLTATSNTLRVLQWNVQQGWTTDSKPNLNLVADWVVKMNPDVISFNEINHSSTPANDYIKLLADGLKARTGATWMYKWVQKGGAATGEGEAVMSRLPLDATASDLLTCTRSVAEATVMVNGRPINIASTHLDYTSDSTCRLNEIKQLKPWFAGFAEQRIIMGDFNRWPGTTEITEMTKDYHDSWADAVAARTAVAYPDNPDGNTRHTRIDYVFFSRGATALVLKGARVYDTRDPAGVCPSDHNPLVATFEVR